MNPVAHPVSPSNYLDTPSLALALHHKARRDRAAAIGRLGARLFDKAANALLSLRLRQPISQTLAHWG